MAVGTSSHRKRIDPPFFTCFKLQGLHSLPDQGLFQETSGHADTHPVSSSCFVEKSSGAHGTGVSLSRGSYLTCRPRRGARGRQRWHTVAGAGVGAAGRPGSPKPLSWQVPGLASARCPLCFLGVNTVRGLCCGSERPGCAGWGPRHRFQGYF